MLKCHQCETPLPLPASYDEMAGREQDNAVDESMDVNGWGFTSNGNRNCAECLKGDV